MTDLTNFEWRKSTHSGSGNTCVELADLDRSGIAVRDSTNPSDPVLAFGRREWRALFQGIKSGVFDLA